MKRAEHPNKKLTLIYPFTIILHTTSNFQTTSGMMSSKLKLEEALTEFSFVKAN